MNPYLYGFVLVLVVILLEVVIKANECSKHFDIQNYITDIDDMNYVDYEYWLDNRLSEIERDLGY